MALPSFSFKGTSSTSFPITVNQLPPIQTPKRAGAFTKVAGRDGYLWQDEGSYEPLEKEIIFTINDLAQLQAVKNWLIGSGDLILSSEPTITYKAVIAEQIDYDRFLMVRRGSIKLICQPYGYLASGLTLITKTTTPTTVVNPGNTASDPIIKIFGTGSITLTINGKSVIIANVASYVTIDSVRGECYKDTTSKNNDMTGDFPKLATGTSNISWTGTVTSLEIIPNWRNV